MSVIREDSPTSLADKIRERKLPFAVTKWHINKAGDEGDVEYLKRIYRQQEEEKLPFLVDTTASSGDQTQPATVPSERTESAQDGPGPVSGPSSGGEAVVGSGADSEQKWKQKHKAAGLYKENRDLLLKAYAGRGKELSDVQMTTDEFLSRLFPADYIWIGEKHMTGEKWAHHFGYSYDLKYRDPFICPNPFKEGSKDRRSEEVECLKYLVLESDTLSEEQTLSMFEYTIEEFGLQLVAIVHSGNKSLHGWFRHPGKEWLYAHKPTLEALGFDPSCTRSAQPVRLPGVIRKDTGKSQALRWFKDPEDYEGPSAKSVDVVAGSGGDSRQNSEKPTFTLDDVKKFVQLPKAGQTVAQFSDDLAKKLSKVSELDPDSGMFQKDHKLVTIRKNGSLSFEEMTPVKFITWADRRAIIGRFPKKEEKDGPGFYKDSMSESLSRSVLAGDEFINTFPVIGRILDVPIPVRNGKEIVYPKQGYNPDLELYCDSKVSEVNPLRLADGSLDLEQARKVIEQIHEGFAFADEQSKTHAIARLFTPYCRGLMGFSARTPLWFYEGNRPGVGKDYLAGITQTVYLGGSFEDAAISKNQEETAKRISSALRSGRRQMHFANCQQHLDDEYLTQAITGQTFNYRSLGSNTGSSDLKLPNELDFSISANVGLTYREDLERRFRKIRLECFEEDINSRTFPIPELHKWVADNRALVLSAIATFVQHWIDQGEPAKASTFSSFYEWSRVVGGILVCGGFGDPCEATEVKDEAGGDLKTKAMGSLASLVYDKHPNEWIDKGEVYKMIGEAYEQGAEDLHWFGDPMEMGAMAKLTEKAIASRTKISMALKSFHRRLLRGVRMEVQKQTKHNGDTRVRFTRKGDAEQTDLSV